MSNYRINIIRGMVIMLAVAFIFLSVGVIKDPVSDEFILTGLSIMLGCVAVLGVISLPESHEEVEGVKASASKLVELASSAWEDIDDDTEPGEWAETLDNNPRFTNRYLFYVEFAEEEPDVIFAEDNRDTLRSWGVVHATKIMNGAQLLQYHDKIEQALHDIYGYYPGTGFDFAVDGEIVVYPVAPVEMNGGQRVGQGYYVPTDNVHRPECTCHQCRMEA